MKKKYYIYAGYYELWISDVKLGRPLTYRGFSYTLENAIERCRRMDEDASVCYASSLKEEVKDEFPWIDFEEEKFEDIFPVFNEQEYKLAA